MGPSWFYLSWWIDYRNGLLKEVLLGVVALSITGIRSIEDNRRGITLVIQVG